MDLALSGEQEALRDTVARFFSKVASAERVRAAEPLGFDAAVWRGLADMGVPTMAADGGATLADVSVVAREAGAHLAPVPIVEAAVTNRLLTRCAHAVDDTTVRTLALRPATGGRAALVPGGAVAAEVVVLGGGDLLLVRPGPTGERRAPANLGSAPLADIDITAGRRSLLTPADGSAVDEHARALDEWRALTASWLVGLGRAALDLGVSYVKDRRQFGVPIGSFQAVQHRLADLATALDGAALLADKAVWTLDTDAPGAATFPAMAFSYCGEAAQRAAAASLHLHGGYGFMEEYDIQLHFRRAKAARLVLADPCRELVGLADRLFGPVETSTGAGR